MIVVDDLAIACYDGAEVASIHEDVFVAEVIRRGIESVKTSRAEESCESGGPET